MSDKIPCPKLACAKQISIVNNCPGDVNVSVVNGVAAFGPHLPSDLVDGNDDSKVAAKLLGSSSGADALSADDDEDRGKVKVAEDGDVLDAEVKEVSSLASTAGSHVFDDCGNEEMSADKPAACVDSLAHGLAPSNVSVLQLAPDPVVSALASAAPAPAQLAGILVSSAPSAVANVQPVHVALATVQVAPAATAPVVAMLGQVLHQADPQGLPALVSDESSSMPTRGDVRHRYGGVDSSNEAASVVLDFKHDPMETLYGFVVESLLLNLMSGKSYPVASLFEMAAAVGQAFSVMFFLK